MANREDRKKKFEETYSKMETKYSGKGKGEETTSLPASQNTQTSSGGSMKETKQAQRQQKFESTLAKMEARYNKSASVDDTYINTFLQDAQSFLNRSASAVNGLSWSSATSGDRYNSWKNERSSMEEKAEKIRSYLRQNKNSINSSAYKELNSVLDEIYWGGVRASVAFNKAGKYYSQWKTEDEYNKWKKDTEEYEAMMAYDTEKGAKEIEDLMKQAQADEKEYWDLYNMRTSYLYNASLGQPDDFSMGIEARMKEILDKYGAENINDIQNQITQKEAYQTQAERLQEGVRLGSVGDRNSEYYDPEYANWANTRGNIPKREDLVAYDSMLDQTKWYTDANGKLYDAFGTEIDPYKTDSKGNIQHPSQGSVDSSDKLGIFLSASGDDVQEAAGTYLNTGGTWETIVAEGSQKHWDRMRENEINTYYYYLNKDGSEAAEKYLNSIQETLNYREGEEKYKAMKDNTLLELAFGVAAGLDQFGSSTQGLRNAITGNDEYVPASATQYASGMVREDLADNGPKLPDWLGGGSVGQAAYDTITTTSNMLPSILTSVAINAIAPGAGIAVGGKTIAASAIAGNAVMGASAVGSAYNEMINLGYDAQQARAYGALVGASEIALQSLLGGVSQLGGGLIGNGVAKVLGKADNALAKIAIKFGNSNLGKVIINAVEEGGEEYLQSILEPVFRNMIFGEENDISLLSEDALYSALLGALTGGVFEASGVVTEAAKENANMRDIGRTIVEADGGVDALKALAMDVSGANPKLTKQADKVSSEPATGKGLGKVVAAVKNSSNQQKVGKLYQTVSAEVTTQNQADVAKALNENGFSQSSAKNIAEAIVARANGVELNKFQKATLEAVKDNKKVEEIADKLYKDMGSSVNKRDINLARYNLGINYGVGIGPDAAKANTAEADKEIATAEGNLTANAKTVSEGSYEVAENGKATISGQEVTLDGFKKTADGAVVVATKDNQTAAPGDVTYSSKGQALVYENYANIETTTDNPVIANMDLGSRSALAKLYDPASGVSAKEFFLGANHSWWYGFRGIAMDEKTLPANSYVRSLSKEQRDFAYELGREAGKAAAITQGVGIEAAYEKAVEKLGGKEAAKAVAKRNKGQVIIESGIKQSSMTEKQKASVRMAKIVAEATGANIRVYHGVKEYGKYDTATGEILLNINAMFSGQSMMAFTLGHELVHMAKQWSPAEFKDFADYLLDQYGKKGVSVEVLIREQMANAKNNGYELNEDEAYEEVIADACQRMLLDSDAAQKMAAFKAQNPTRWQQIVDAIKEFIAKIRKLFEGAEPDSTEAAIYKELDAAVKEHLEEKFVKMVMDAGEHMSTIRNAFGKGTVVEVNENGEFTLAKGEDSNGATKFLYNDYTWENGGRETLATALKAEGFSQEDINAALTIMDGKHNLVKELAQEFQEQDRINQVTITTDIKDGHSVLSALVSNGDYPVNIDLLMVCKKRKAYQRVINRLCETGLIQQATVDALAIAEINKILGKYGFETACLGCFVESRRLRIQEWAETICKEWNAEVKKRNPNAKAFGFGKGEATLTADEVMQLVGELESGGEKNEKGNLNLGQGSAVKRMGVLLDKVPSLRKTLSIEDLITPDGLSSLRSFDSNLFSMVKSRYGSNSPKFVQEFNPYNHELAKYGKVPTEYKSLREYLYAIGGARMQSFSDFIVENWFDYCQIVADLATRKLPMHTYTKEIALAKLFGLTGIKINMSLIPDIDRSLGKEYAGLTRNAKGELELIWADKDRFKTTGGKSYMQSINFNDAIALQEDPRYSANVGTIAVGVSDRHILMMLDDPRIRMVIPYHSSGMNPIFADLMGTSYYKDYTMFQNTTVKQLYNSKGQKVSLKLDKTQTGKLTSGFQFNEVLQDLGDARAAAQAYKDWCADASEHTITIKGETYTAELTPKFNDFSGHENYYKLLEDFNTYDCISEQAAPQGDVQQNYPEDFDKILKAELTAQESHRQKQVENQAFDKAMEEIETYLKSHTKADTVFYAEQHGVKLSAKDKKLGAEDKKKLAELRKGMKNSMPKTPAPTFYSHMAKVVEGMKQEKFGAASVVSMLRDPKRGVRAEEIKWSGIETWLEGKKSVTKAELLEFIKGSMLQIEEEVLDNKERPYTEDQQKRLDEYTAKRDKIAQRLANEWKKLTGEEFPIRNTGADLESAVARKIIETNLEQKKATFEGRLLAKLKNDLKGVIENNDDFGFDSWMDALRSIHRHRREFINYYEVSTNDKAIIFKYCNALNAYNELPNVISEADSDRLRAIASETNPWNRKIMEVKHEYNEEAAKHMTKWGDYRLRGGKNYREILFRIPGSTYTNDAMYAHWKEKAGVLAHARVQDFDTFLGNMLFIEEIQSDWHNEGRKEGYRKEGYRKEGEKTDEMLRRESQEAYKEFYSAVENMVYSNANWEDDNSVYYVHPVVVAEMFEGNESYFEQYGFTDEQRQTIRSMVAEETARQEAIKTAPKQGTVPDAPFKDNYHEYVLKRILRMAAEEGYDSIGWTTADIQSKRWSDKYAKGYSIEYDQDIPKFLGRYGDKWDTKVGKTVLDDGTEVWSMAITDSMKDSVLYEGQPKYSMPKRNSPYSYEALVSKPDMLVTTVDSNVPKNRADLVHMAKQNAAMVGKIDPKSGSVSVYVKDIGRDVGIGRDGLKHSLDGGRISVNAPILVKVGEIISNSIRINELTPREDRIDESYVLIGAARNADNDLYVVRSVVNRFTHKLVSLDVLYAINAKKEPAALLPLSAGNPALGTDSTISIAKLLDYVNQYFPDVLPEEVLKHYGHDSRPEGKLGEDALYKNPNTRGMSSRQLLADAFDELVQTPKERELMDQYRNNISKVEDVQDRLQKVRGKIRELTKENGDKAKIAALNKTAAELANLIDRYDRKLLEMEASKPLRDVLARAKSAAYKEAKQRGEKTMKEYRQQVSERFDRGVEGRRKTEMRHKIQNVVKELNDLLLNESKKRHVPDSLKKAVAGALSIVNMDTVDAEERAAKYAALIAKEQAKANPDQDKIDSYTMTMENILRQGEKMGQRLKELRDAYEEISESDDPDIANAYDPVIAGAMKELSQTVGNTSIRNMTLDQLSDVYDMYRMVLTRVRDANKTLLENIKESISNLASRVIGEVRMTGGEHTYRAAILDPARKFLWNNLKPVYAMEYIGSSTLTKVFDNVRAGEDTWAKDVTEAREYYLDKSKKYGYDSWDFKKKYSFKSASDIEFELTLEQILSLYAYSKREQAHDHLRLGGFVFDSNIETYKDKGSKILKYKVNTADAHQISPEILADITGKLTKEQMGFVDDMQEYLSAVMGAKGNEVTSKMYGVKLFKEKFYFPLKSAKQFMFEQNEVSGEVKIKNSGFTNKVVAKANNPVILSNFMDVWSGHVNDMSMYHAFTLPLEDFNRVFNYNSPKKEGQPPVSVKGTIQSAYSPAAVSYVKNLITDLNGGARTDSTTGFINKMMGLFKKGSVFASLSVVVQQPSAIARAAALVENKYFIGPKADHKRHKVLWDEVKQYAPVAIIKEMGYFDTNMGKSTQDFIQGKEYDGFKEKMKALVIDSDYRDEILSKAPALADEIAWCSIWEAVKREMHDKYPGLDTKAEPFLMLCGSRFTEVITKTQVYDSVLSRSGNMRSKDTGMKMATSFMAEPTTSINMIADALLQGKRGNRKYARKAIGAVIASQIFNAILVSFVYAGRDDDEDETYIEKYIGTLSGEVWDSLNPAGYIPFIKDIMSIVQGYDVERSDMAVISDLWKAIENLSNDKVPVYRKVESFAGSIAQIFGLPVKNIMRDVRGIYQTVMSFVNGQQTTKAGVGYAVKSALPEWISGGDVSNNQQLYEAILSGDQVQIARVKGRYKDADAVNSAIRKALRENDPRIREAAIAWNANDLDEYMRIAKEIIAEKHFVQDDVVLAIRAEANALEPEDGTPSSSKAKGLFTAEKFAEAIAQGDQATANAIKMDIIDTAQKNGKSADKAEESFQNSAKGELKELFLSGTITEAKAIEALTSFCGDTQEDAEGRVAEWDFETEYGFKYDEKKEKFLSGEISASELKDLFMTVEGKTEKEAAATVVNYTRDAYEDGLYDRSKAKSTMVKYGGLTGEEAESKLRYIDVKKQFPDTYVDDAWVEEYYKEVQSSGISMKVFVDYRNRVKGITGEDKKEGRMAVINSMPISNAQKDALYYAEGWAASKISQAPWH